MLVTATALSDRLAATLRSARLVARLRQAPVAPHAIVPATVALSAIGRLRAALGLAVGRCLRHHLLLLKDYYAGLFGLVLQAAGHKLHDCLLRRPVLVE